MPDPTRPVDDAAIETEWGQAVHDATFVPKGTRVEGGASLAVGTGYEQLPLNTALDDPGSWLTADTLEVPADAGGLYLWAVRYGTDNGDDDESTRFLLKRNGSNLASQQTPQQGTTTVFESMTGVIELAGGDVITAWAAKTGGLDPDVTVHELSFIRLGTAIGT